MKVKMEKYQKLKYFILSLNLFPSRVSTYNSGFIKNILEVMHVFADSYCTLSMSDRK
jgi:hypothetical protein